MNDELIEYFNLKYIICILYNEEMCKNILSGSKDEQILNYGFFYLYINVIDNFVEMKIIDKTIKERFYLILNYFKEKLILNNKNQAHYINLINDKIIKLNNSLDTKCKNFYINELVKRFGFVKIFNIRELAELKKALYNSLCYDYLFLYFHLTDLDNETFTQMIPEMIMDEYYFASLNAIVTEFPELLENDKFKKRVKTIIELNKNSQDLFSKKNRFEKRYILKNNRKYDKLLNKAK